jgi:hypothetical protein
VNGEAVRQYKEASGLDYRMSMFVIDDLAPELVRSLGGRISTDVRRAPVIPEPR